MRSSWRAPAVTWPAGTALSARLLGFLLSRAGRAATGEHKGYLDLKRVK
jgi:hypothetical protein